MDRVLFVVADTPITLEIAVFAAGGLFAALLIALLVIVVRQSRARAEEAEARRVEMGFAQHKNAELEKQLAGLLQSTFEMSGRMQTMAEIFGKRGRNAEIGQQRTGNGDGRGNAGPPQHVAAA